MAEKKLENAKVSIEEALNISGFGIYSYLNVALTGLTTLAFACLAYSSTVIVSISACELETTSAQQGLIASAPIVGLLFGAIPGSYLGDRYGRRKVLILSLVISASLNVIRAISVNWIMMFIMEFLVNLFGSCQSMVAMTLLSECVPLANRNLSVLLVTSIFLPGLGVISIIALPIAPLSFSHYLPGLDIYWNSWRTLQLVYTAPALVVAVALLFMTESPKFVLSTGDEEGALDILRTIHRRNNPRFKGKFPVIGLKREAQVKVEKTTSAKDHIMPLFRLPLLKFTIIMTTLNVFEQIGALQLWFPTIANRFMQMIETGQPMNVTLCDVLRSNVEASSDPTLVPCSLNTTAMWIVLASGSFQAIANLGISTVVNIVGRRNIVIVLTAVCGLSGILVNLVPNTVASAVLFIVMLLGYIVVGLYTAIGVAVFPTHVRALAVAFATSGGRLATIAAIQILNYLLVNNCDAGFYIFGSLYALSSVVAYFLPDDRLLAKQAATKQKTEESTRL